MNTELEKETNTDGGQSRSNTVLYGEWQPIETAPKDKNIILSGMRPDGPVVSEGYWFAPEHGEYVGDCGGECRCPEYEDAPEPFWMSMDGGFSDEYPATHWMPKPEPPAIYHYNIQPLQGRYCNVIMPHINFYNRGE